MKCRGNLSNTEGFEFLTGPQSFGAILEDEDYPSLPSPTTKSPDGRKYYRGGYITRYHGSRYEGNVDAIQVEIPAELRVRSLEREKFAKALGRSIHKFYQTNYSGC